MGSGRRNRNRQQEQNKSKVRQPLQTADTQPDFVGPPRPTSSNSSGKGESFGPWQKFELGTLITLVTAVIAFAFWIGGLSNKVEEHTEKLKELGTGTADDIKDLRGKISADVKDLENRISNGGVLARRYQGDQSDLHRRRQFQFMTPSNETWASKESFYGSSPAQNGGETIRLEEFNWQKVEDTKIEEFGREIIAKGFTKGWRRYPYAGQGRYRDVGWWWVVTVDDSFNIERFVDYYRHFWGTSEMYVEEFEARSDVMPDGVIPHPVLPNNRSSELTR